MTEQTIERIPHKLYLHESNRYFEYHCDQKPPFGPVSVTNHRERVRGLCDHCNVELLPADIIVQPIPCHEVVTFEGGREYYRCSGAMVDHDPKTSGNCFMCKQPLTRNGVPIQKPDKFKQFSHLYSKSKVEDVMDQIKKWFVPKNKE